MERAADLARRVLAWSWDPLREDDFRRQEVPRKMLIQARMAVTISTVWCPPQTCISKCPAEVVASRRSRQDNMVKISA